MNQHRFIISRSGTTEWKFIEYINDFYHKGQWETWTNADLSSQLLKYILIKMYIILIREHNSILCF